MLAPKKVKFRKSQKGKMRGVSKGATRVEFGTPHGMSGADGIRLLGDHVLPALST